MNENKLKVMKKMKLYKTFYKYSCEARSQTQYLHKTPDAMLLNDSTEVVKLLGPALTLPKP